MRNQLRLQPLLIFVAAAVTLLVTLLFLFFPREVKTEPAKEGYTIVKLETVKKGDEPIIVTAFGTVMADREVDLKPEVSGRVVEQSRNLVIGGLVKKGETLVKIDPRDYKIAVEQERAGYDKAVAEYRIEQGRQLVAQKEWELLKSTVKVSDLSEELALRRPQLKQKQADIDAAKSRLEKAKLDLQRTSIAAPFDAIVIDETVEVGDLLTPQTQIAGLVSTDAFRVRVSVPSKDLHWIKIPGAKATIIHEMGGGQKQVREGFVKRLLGDVETSGRMARVLVEIKDPIGTEDKKHRGNPLLLGSYVRVDMQGPVLKDVFKVPREAVRKNDYVWVKNKEEKLEIRKVTVLYRGEDTVLVGEGLNEGDEIVVSNISAAVPGMKLKGLQE